MKLKTDSSIFLLSVLFVIAIANSLPNGCDSNEFLIDTSVVYATARYDQKYSSIAFDGTNYFIVWQDERNGSNFDVYGTHLAQDGRILEAAGIAISTSYYNELSPAIVFDGVNYLVVWSDDRNGSLDIYGTRISQAGIVLDSNGLLISNATNDQQTPSIAFDGANYLVIWQDNRSGSNYDIYGTRVSQSGLVLDPNGFAISDASDDQEYPAISFDGSNYLVVWQDQRNGYPNIDIYGARVNPAGNVLDPNGIAISNAPLYQEFPTIAFDGTNYMVAWQDGRGATYDIYGARVNQSGNVIDTSGIVISGSICGQYLPSVSFDGTNYLVTWHDNRGISYDIYGARINQAGISLDPNGIPIFNGNEVQKYSSVAFGGTNYLVVWQSEFESYLNNIDIYGARVNQFGMVIDSIPIILSTEASNQLSSAAAFDGTNYLVVWQGTRYYDYNLYGVRINQQGIVLFPTPIEISTSPLEQLNPAVVFGETSYFVVWQDERNGNYDIYGARITQTGIVLDPSGIPIATTIGDQCSPAIAFDGVNYLVVWDDYRSGYNKDIYGARVSQTGTVLDPAGIRIAWRTEDETNPTVAFDGTNYLVGWDFFCDSNTVYDISGARISPSGTIIDPIAFRISYATENQRYPSITFDGTNYLVVWEDYRNGSNGDIYGARVTPSRIVLDPTGIALTATINDQKYPSVAFDGTDYLITWQENRIGYEWDIYGARLSPAGILIDSFPIMSQTGNQILPAFAHGNGNQMLLTGSGFTDLIGGKTYNSMRVLGKFYPFIGIEEERITFNAEHLMLEIYPNPVQNHLAVRVPSTADCRMIKIFDVSGKLIKEIEILRYTQNDGVRDAKISLKGINPGIYFLRLGKETKKFLVLK